MFPAASIYSSLDAHVFKRLPVICLSCCYAVLYIDLCNLLLLTEYVRVEVDDILIIFDDSCLRFYMISVSVLFINNVNKQKEIQLSENSASVTSLYLNASVLKAMIPETWKLKCLKEMMKAK